MTNDLKGYCHCEVVPGVKCAPCRAAEEIEMLRNQLRSLGWEPNGDSLTRLPSEPKAKREDGTVYTEHVTCPKCKRTTSVQCVAPFDLVSVECRCGETVRPALKSSGQRHVDEVVHASTLPAEIVEAAKGFSGPTVMRPYPLT